MLKMNKSVIKYSVKFQCIAVLTDWNNDVLILQYYWRLSKDIKDKIVWRNYFKELQEMIDIFINIDSWQWKWQMKKIKSYTALRM